MEQPVHLIQSCIYGDRNSQRELYEIYIGKMFALCLRYSSNREEAEEIVQEGFVQVFKSLKNFKHAGSFEGWIKKIMIYCALQHFRTKSKLRPVVNIEEKDLEQLGQEDIISQLGKKELLKLINDLPPACRIVFNLHVFEGMKHREIAAQLGISEGTSKSNLFDAKAILQRAVTNSLRIAKKM